MDKKVDKDALSAGTSTLSWDEGGGKTLQFLVDNGLCPNHSIIDYGCGTLPLLDKAYDYGITDYIGIDISKKAIDAGKRLVGHKSSIGRFFVIDTMDFDGLDICGDYLIAISVLNHNPITHFETFVKNIHKITHNRSKIFFTVWLDKYTRPSSITNPPLNFYYSLKDMQDICKKYGLDVHVIPMDKYWGHNETMMKYLSMIQLI